MHDEYGKWMSSFEVYLRTGRQVSDLATISLKFNPWHDPDDGRFTFREQGISFGGGRNESSGPSGSSHTPKPKRPPFGGFGGGGGGFNGGGASGSWPAPKSTATDNSTRSTQPVAKPTQGPSVGPPIQSGAKPAPKPKAAANPIHNVVERDGFRFGLDGKRRTIIVTGQLSLPDATERSKTQQRRAGGSDRRSDDDGGHFVAARFGGPKDAFNHFAQNASFNRGGYRVMENEWAKSLREGKHILVDFSVTYLKNSNRPKGLVIHSKMNGVTTRRVFRNEKDHGK